MIKFLRLAVILILAALVFFGTFKLASSAGEVPWFRISDISTHQNFPAIAYHTTDNQYFGTLYQATAHFEVYLPVLLRDYQPPTLPTSTPITPGPTSTLPTFTPTPTATSTPTSPPALWVNIMTEDFEGSFPSAWTISDGQPGSGEYYWGKQDCRAFIGDYSGWAIGGGSDGSLLPCGSSYPENVKSWMIYGPFSLADASAADLRYQTWINTGSPSNTDQNFCRMASTDGINFSGDCFRGNSQGGIEQTLDLSNVTGLGSLLGQTEVYIALYFENLSTAGSTEGVYVDDIILRKCVSTSCPTLAADSQSINPPGVASFPAIKSLNRNKP